MCVCVYVCVVIKRKPPQKTVNYRNVQFKL